MKVKIVEVDSDQLVSAEIREGDKRGMPSLTDGWSFNFSKHSLGKGKRAFILVKEDSPTIIEGCMIFSIHETFGPFMNYLEVAPHNWGSNGKYKGVAGCLIAYACGLSFNEGALKDKGFLTFKAFGKDEDSKRRLEEVYRTKYKAIMNPKEYMEIHPDESKTLIKDYKMKKDKIDMEFDDIIGDPNYEHQLTKAEHDQIREYRDSLYNKRSREDKIDDILTGFRFALRNYAETENPKKIIELGDFLYELLNQIKVKKGSFAEYIGISSQNINKYFNGDRKFAIEHLLKLEKLFDVHAETLLEIQLKNELIKMKKSHKGEYDKYKLEDLLPA